MVVTLLLASLMAPPAQAGKPDRAQKIALKAMDKGSQGQALEAYKLCTKALKLDSDNMIALYVCGALELQAGMGSQNDALMGRGIDMLSRVSRESADPQLVSVASDALVTWVGGQAMVLPDPVCPAESVQHLTVAEQRFAKEEWVEAGRDYALALEGCPENSNWWVYFGDTYFAQGQYAQASQMYHKAIALDPCHWSAHRFLADALWQTGDPRGAYDEVVRAVVCNPSYDAGWTSLRQVTEHLGGEYRRPDMDWSALPSDGLVVAQDGTVEVGDLDDPTDEAQVAVLLDTVYGVGRAALLQKRPELSPLERDVMALEVVAEALGGFPLAGSLRREDTRTWELFRRAWQAGRLDTAVFMLHLDDTLVPEFMEYRDPHLDALECYVRDELAVLPAEGPQGE